jgi:hypothetical protein
MDEGFAHASPDDYRWRVSIHEAGHAVCARLAGLPCGGASAAEGLAFAGFPRDCGERSICALMAGAAAEVAVFGDHHPYGLKVDRERAWARLMRLGYDDGGDELWGWTVDLMREHRDAIIRVATQLFHARWLSGDEIDALIAE